MNYEIEHEKVYGDPFSKIQKADIHQTISNYEIRFQRNLIDYKSLFKKKKVPRCRLWLWKRFNFYAK